MPIVRLNQLPEGSGNLSSDDLFVFMDSPSSGGITKKINLSELTSIILMGHTHVANDITDFNAAVSGLWPNIIDGGNATTSGCNT